MPQIPRGDRRPDSPMRGAGGHASAEVSPPRGDDPAAWRKFVEAWQDPIYSLARRLLGNAADAADATQEIFVRVWRHRDAFDRSREFRPWLYRVAWNAIRGQQRKQRTRREKEREVPVPSRHRSDGDRLERSESARLLEEHLQRLPEEARTLIVLHYQQGLSQHEIARTIGMRRTTVQSRLGKALDRLRASLKSHGHFALIPAVELALRQSPAHAAPAALTESLLTVPTTAAAVAAGSGAAGMGLLVGGISMSKAIALTILAVAALSLVAGWGIGSSKGSGAEGAAEPVGLTLEEQASLQQEVEELRGERASLKGELAAAVLSSSELSEQLAQARVRLDAAAGATAAVDPAAGSAEEQIDWDALAALIGDNREFMFRVAEMIGSDANLRDELTAEERLTMMTLQREWIGAAMIARKSSDVPFLEPEVLPNLLSTLYGSTLDLDDAQLAALEESSYALLDEWGGAREGSPLEVYQARQEILAGVDQALRGSLGAEQLAQYGGLAPLTGEMLKGPLSTYQLGLEGRDGLPERVGETLRGHYGIGTAQEPRFQEILDEYGQEARGIMDRHLPEGKTIASLSDSDRARLELEYLRLQLASDARFTRLLDDEQLANLRGKMPAIFTFEPTGSSSISVNDEAGF